VKKANVKKTGREGECKKSLSNAIKDYSSNVISIFEHAQQYLILARVPVPKYCINEKLTDSIVNRARTNDVWGTGRNSIASGAIIRLRTLGLCNQNDF